MITRKLVNLLRPLRLSRPFSIAQGPQDSSGTVGKESEQKQAKSQRIEQYFYLPVTTPVFPNFSLVAKINPHMQKLLTNLRTRTIVAIMFKDQEELSRKLPGSYKQFLETYNQIDKDQDKQRNQLLELTKQEASQINNSLVNFDPSLYSKGDIPISTAKSKENLYQIGTVCRLLFQRFNGQTLVILKGTVRVQLESKQVKQNQIQLRFKSLGTDISASQQISYNKFKQLLAIYQRVRYLLSNNSIDIISFVSTKNLQILCGTLCSTISFSRPELYHLFSELNVKQRFQICLNYYQRFQKLNSQEWEKAEKEFESITDNQAQKDKLNHIYEYYKKLFKLGQNKDFLNKVKKDLASRKLPQEVVTIIQYELKDLSEMNQSAPDAVRKKHFIQTLLSYPFGVFTVDTFELEKAKAILDQQHFGMKELKQRILQFIAVAKRKGTLKQKVILLNGPPGVGKTSIAKSIAKCLNRAFGRISLGGQYDVNIIKGHRKTYVGAYPGKIYQTIKNCKSQNPVILLDEIDKIQASHRGNLQQVILELFDPNQNKKFKDQFVDISVDLSNVLFVCTSNDMANIPAPLRDRLEIMQVSGYTTPQKIQISKRHIIHSSRKQAGILQEINIKDQAIEAIINGYCRQAGVRSLQQAFNNIFFKLAYKTVTKAPLPANIGVDQVKQLLGHPKYSSDRLFPGIPPAGIMIGLAYTEMGGCILYLQSLKTNIKPAELGKGTLTVTGRVAEVMKQSCTIAYTYVRHLLSQKNNNFLECNDIHLNFPDIEIGKDGPSAGIAIASTLYSLALNKPAIHSIAMTGQINLSGQVCPIGGVKQKLLAAKRQGIRKVIIPKQNQRDLKLLQEEFLTGLQVLKAEKFSDVIKEVFGEED